MKKSSLSRSMGFTRQSNREGVCRDGESACEVNSEESNCVLEASEEEEDAEEREGEGEGEGEERGVRSEKESSGRIEDVE